MKYFWNILISLDQLVNVILGPVLNIALNPIYRFGKPDDTLSEVFARNVDNCRFCRYACWVLFWLDKNHCEKSVD